MKHLTIALIPFACALSVPASAQSWETPPAPPAGAAPNQAIPAHDTTGASMTPNRNLTTEEASWHLRAALNVAALGCRDASEAETIAAYNAMLSRHRETLAQADAGVKAHYRRRFGEEWETTHDRQMTRVYNFFAQPTAHDGFCATAHQVLSEVNEVTPQSFADFAIESLPRLEAPFIAFYRDYEAYRVAYADWQGRRGGVAVASTSVGGALTR